MSSLRIAGIIVPYLSLVACGEKEASEKPALSGAAEKQCESSAALTRQVDASFSDDDMTKCVSAYHLVHDVPGALKNNAPPATNY